MTDINPHPGTLTYFLLFNAGLFLVAAFAPVPSGGKDKSPVTVTGKTGWWNLGGGPMNVASGEYWVKFWFEMEDGSFSNSATAVFTVY